MLLHYTRGSEFIHWKHCQWITLRHIETHWDTLPMDHIETHWDTTNSVSRDTVCSHNTSRELCAANAPLRWRHNGRDGVSNHQPPECLLNRLFRRRSTKTSKLRVTGLCAGNSPVPAQMACNAESVSIWWRHHALIHWGRNKMVAILETSSNHFFCENCFIS